jgi:hypothetical protein
MRARVEALPIREELKSHFLTLKGELSKLQQSIESVMRTLYDERMKITGQNGISDYDLGFTNFLYTFETSTTARQIPPERGRVHGTALV